MKPKTDKASYNRAVQANVLKISADLELKLSGRLLNIPTLDDICNPTPDCRADPRQGVFDRGDPPRIQSLLDARLVGERGAELREGRGNLGAQLRSLVREVRKDAALQVAPDCCSDFAAAEGDERVFQRRGGLGAQLGRHPHSLTQLIDRPVDVAPNLVIGIFHRFVQENGNSLDEAIDDVRVEEPGRVSRGFAELDLDRTTIRRKPIDRKSTRLNSSHLGISYAVF